MSFFPLNRFSEDNHVLGVCSNEKEDVFPPFSGVPGHLLRENASLQT